MKKIIKTLLLFSAFLLLFGCNKEKEERRHPGDVILEDIKYSLDQEDTAYNIKYKVAKNFKKTVLSNAVNYFSEKKDGESYFVIRILYYPNKDINYAVKDSVTEYDNKYEKTIKDVDYMVVHFKNSVGNAETNIYYHTHNKNTYAFVFTSGIDISALEKKFLQRVEY